MAERQKYISDKDNNVDAGTDGEDGRAALVILLMNSGHSGANEVTYHLISAQ